MTASTYNSYAESCLRKTGNNPEVVNIYVQLVDTTVYTFNATHVFLADIPALARVGDPGLLSNLRVDNGVFRADNLVLTPLTGTAHAAIIYEDTGVEATSPLMFYNDQSVDLPITGDGSPQLLKWNDGEGEIFRFVRTAPPE